MNNSPAFPSQSVYIEDQETNSRGMSLRDYMAAKAMQGMMHDVDQPKCDYIAQTAYKMADTMLKTREA